MSVKRIIVVAVCAIALAGFIALAISDAVKRNDQLEFQKVELKSKSVEIQQLNNKYEKLDTDLKKAQEDKNSSQEEIEKLKQQEEQLRKEKESLEAKLQAKIESKNRLAAASTQVVNAATNTQTASAYSGGGSCVEWIAQAGITHPIATELITRESGCNPCAYNPSKSDCNYKGNAACGIPQALPCSKLRDVAGCAMTDPVCQLRWMQSYVMGRYGSWEAAKAHHDRMGWY